jgi:hypothetical protein
MGYPTWTLAGGAHTASTNETIVAYPSLSILICEYYVGYGEVDNTGNLNWSKCLSDIPFTESGNNPTFTISTRKISSELYSISIKR